MMSGWEKIVKKNLNFFFELVIKLNNDFIFCFVYGSFGFYFVNIEIDYYCVI